MTYSNIGSFIRDIKKKFIQDTFCLHLQSLLLIPVEAYKANCFFDEWVYLYRLTKVVRQ